MRRRVRRCLKENQGIHRVVTSSERLTFPTCRDGPPMPRKRPCEIARVKRSADHTDRPPHKALNLDMRLVVQDDIQQ